jgi:hypothetical protein
MEEERETIKKSILLRPLQGLPTKSKIPWGTVQKPAF